MAKPAELIAGARDLIPVLDTCWPETDESRKLPRAVLEQVREAGLYSMVVPQEFGGAATDLHTFVEVIETVARGNSAAAWGLAASSVASLFALGLPKQGLETVYVNGPHVIFAGTATIDRDAAKAVPVEGGYVVTGRWRFGSGSEDADWLIASAEVAGRGEKPGPDAEMRYVIFPREDVDVIDTWNVIGMKGTGSHDWSVTEAFVPRERSEQSQLVQGPYVPRPWAGPLYRMPLASMTALHFSSVATGLARRGIDTLMDLANFKTPHRAPGLLKTRVQVQEALARAEAALESARAYRSDVLRDVWATLEANEPLSMTQRARIRLAGANAAESAVKAVDLMYGAGGTTSIEDDFPLSRVFRDVHVIAQHITVLPLQYEYIGKALLGMEIEASRPF
jgi:alkylation response protein AidB-like acyl-CoA dehydrogenase